MDKAEPPGGIPINHYGAAFTNPHIMADRISFWIRNPRHAYNAGLAYLFNLTHPDSPRFARGTVKALDRIDMRGWKCFEWGSGRSTFYFALRSGSIDSVEHSRTWYNIVTRELASRGILNAKVTLLETTEGTDTPDYQNHILAFPDEDFDCVLVDGIRRNECISSCVRKLKPGGLLILDDSQRGYDITPIQGWDSSSETDGIKRTTIYRKPKKSEVAR